MVDTETLTSIGYNDLIKVLSEHYDLAPCSIVQRFKFYNRVRTEGENIANFVASLRDIVTHCDYGRYPQHDAKASPSLWCKSSSYS